MDRNIMLHTSANVDGVFYDELVIVSIDMQIPESRIFKDLIEIVINSSKIGKVSGLLTEYQHHSPERWEKFHYSLNTKEIENFSKARQCYKISVSKLAFIGFLLFWKLLLFTYKERLKKTFAKLDFSSYDEYSEIMIENKKYCSERMKIILKE